MDFAYDPVTFGEIETIDNYTSPNVSLKLSSLSTADFTKKLQSLSILDLGRKKKEETETKSSAKTLQRVKDSIELVNSLQLDYNSIDVLNDNKLSSKFDSKSYIANLTKILETPTLHDISLKASLKALEAKLESDSTVNINEKYEKLIEIGPKGSLERKLLRGLVEEDLIQQNNSKLKKFQKIVKSIESTRPSLSSLFDDYNKLLDSVNDTIEESKELKREISDTIEQKKMILIKKKVLGAFKATFTVSQYEEHLLKFADLCDPIVGTEFFGAINKVKEIQSSCDILLAMEDETLGSKIMKQMNDLLISSDLTIQNYVQNNVQNVYLHSSIKPVDIKTFQKCLIYLYQNSKSKFDTIMANMVEHRRRIIATEFVVQLKGYTDEVQQSSKDSISTKQKSRLFLSSYDTIKFISDTLAYIHSLIVNEMENARSFFTFDFVYDDETRFDKNELEGMVGDIVTNIISGLNNPLKGAVESILRQEVKLSSLVNSHELLELYSSMFVKLLQATDSGELSLLDTIQYLETQTQDRVFYLLSLKFKKLELESLDSTESDDDFVPNWIIEWCATIDELFEPYNSHKNLDDNHKHIIGFSDEQWADLITALINKPLELISRVKDDKKLMNSKKERLILSLNCVDYFKSKIIINNFLTDKSDELQKVLDDYTKELIDLEFTDLLQSSGLFDIFNLINMIFKLDDEFFDVAFYQPIVENKVFNIETFETANSKLEKFLASYINQNELDGLMSPTIFNKVFFDSSVKFIEFYKKLSLIVYEYLRDAEDNPVNVFQWDAITIATLLGVDEYYQERFM